MLCYMTPLPTNRVPTVERQPEYHGVLWLFKTTVNHTKWRRRAVTVKWRCRASCGYSQHSTGKPEWNQASSLTSEIFSNIVPVLHEIKIVGWFRIQFALSFREVSCCCSHTVAVLLSIPPNDGPISKAVAMVWIYACVLCPVVTHSIGHTHCTCTLHSLRLAPQCHAFA